ncbi:hypothetical protein C8R47DRAFT_1313595, partial [Mycena vitilis]
MQGPEFGRRYAVVDRQGFNEPPVVMLRLYYTHTSDSDVLPAESEIPNYDEIDVSGFLCMADLFRVDPQLSGSPGAKESPTLLYSNPPTTPSATVKKSPMPTPPIAPYSPCVHNGLLAIAAALRPGQFSSAPIALTPVSQNLPTERVPEHFGPAGYNCRTTSAEIHGMSDATNPDTTAFVHDLQDDYPSNVAAFNNNCGVTESDKCTRALVGGTFVEPHHVSITFNGHQRRVVVFVFHDLAVKLSGLFVMRFRFCDLSSNPTGFSTPMIQAECYGSSFQIYSTRQVPKLRPSSDLTKALHQQHVPVLYRKRSRHRKRKQASEQSSEASDWEV